jgi:hypothetical protein
MSQPYGVIYVATCKINGKRYVGQTTRSLEAIQTRWNNYSTPEERSQAALKAWETKRRKKIK